MIDENEFKPCPFCGGDDLDYSMKTKTNQGKLRYHATIYCKQCRAYGSRVLTETRRWDDFDEMRRQKSSDEIKSKAIKAWNARAPDHRDEQIKILREGLENLICANEIYISLRNGDTRTKAALSSINVTLKARLAKCDELIKEKENQ